MSGPRIEYKDSTIAVLEQTIRGEQEVQTTAVVPPAASGDGSIFVSLVSYRGMMCCLYRS
jgi:hypothetical protein